MRSATSCCAKKARTSCTVTLNGSPRKRSAATVVPGCSASTTAASAASPAAVFLAKGWLCGCKCAWLLVGAASLRPPRLLFEPPEASAFPAFPEPPSWPKTSAPSCGQGGTHPHEVPAHGP